MFLTSINGSYMQVRLNDGLILVCTNQPFIERLHCSFAVLRRIVLPPKAPSCSTSNQRKSPSCHGFKYFTIHRPFDLFSDHRILCSRYDKEHSFVLHHRPGIITFPTQKSDDALCHEIFGVTDTTETVGMAPKAQDESLQVLLPMLKQVCARLRENILLCSGAETLRFCLQEESTRLQPNVPYQKPSRRQRKSSLPTNPFHKKFSSDTEDTDESSDDDSTASDHNLSSELSTLASEDVQPSLRKRTRRKSRGGRHAKRARLITQPKAESPMKSPRAEVSTETPTIWRQKLPTVPYFEYLSTAIGKNVDQDYKHSSMALAACWEASQSEPK